VIDQVALVEAVAKAVEHELVWDTPEGPCCDGSTPCFHEPEPGCAECATPGWPCGFVSAIVDAVTLIVEPSTATAQIETLKRRERGMLKEMREVETILADVLGYAYDTEYGFAIGDHTPITLAMEARRRIQEGA
jgi:hypothetical protein